jgi:hypothetical protein
MNTTLQAKAHSAKSWQAHVYLHHTGFGGPIATGLAQLLKNSRNSILSVNLEMGMKSNLLVKILEKLWGETPRGAWLQPIFWSLTLR